MPTISSASSYVPHMLAYFFLNKNSRMQEALSYRTCIRHRSPASTYQNNVKMSTGSGSIRIINGGRDDLKSMVKENAVIVFARKGCCMSHVVKHLLQRLGANPAVYEVEEKDLDDVVGQLGGGGNEGRLQFPAVFIGGGWFGGLDRIIAAHITEELTPLLKQAGALWL